jgi:hypothetical protein
MMKKTKRKIYTTLKAKIALEALGEQSTIADLARRLGDLADGIAPVLVENFRLGYTDGVIRLRLAGRARALRVASRGMGASFINDRCV